VGLRAMGVLSDKRVLASAVAAALALVAATAAATPPEPTPERRSAARALADKGYEHYRAGRFADAAETLARAEALFHAPTLTFALAKALAASGRLHDARAAFQRVLDEPLPPAAPADYRRAQESAAVELTALTARIPSASVIVSGAAGRAFTVTVDGAPLAPAALGGRVDLDPGKHTVRVELQGAAPETREIDLAEGAHEDVQITLPAPPPPPPPPPPRPPPRGPLGPSIAALGAGAAVLAVGIGTGADAIVRTRAIKAECDGNRCPPRLEPKAASIRAEAAVSTASFVIAGASAAAGVVLLVLRPKLAARPRVSVQVGPGSLALAGRF